MDDACVDSNKHKDKGERDEAEHEKRPLCISKAEQGAEVIISDRCWVVNNLNDVTTGKGKEKCSLRANGKSVITHIVVNYLEPVNDERGWHTCDTMASMLSSGCAHG